MDDCAWALRLKPIESRTQTKKTGGFTADMFFDEIPCIQGETVSKEARQVRFE
jgi:hypothetical protein